MNILRKLSVRYWWRVWQRSLGLEGPKASIGDIAIVRTILILPLWIYIMDQTVMPIITQYTEEKIIPFVEPIAEEVLEYGEDAWEEYGEKLEAYIETSWENYIDES